MTHVEPSPSKVKARKQYGHVTIKKDPYYNQIKELAHERDITMAEMLERMVTTYVAMLNHRVMGE